MELYKVDGYDDCILGVMERFGAEPVIAYDKDKMLDKLAEQMSADAAEEWFDFNIVGAWVGENTPCFVSRQEWAWQQEQFNQE